MIVLDTNVLSELVKPAPQARVLAWVDGNDPESLFTTAVTEAEMRFGVARLPAGKRRTALEIGVARIFEHLMVGRILSFDSAAARRYAEIAAERRVAGRQVSFIDVQIAAIVSSCSAALATRNTRHFDFGGVEVIDPWA